MNKSKKPNLFLIGAPKAGTSALASLLSKVEEVYLPDSLKEPRYYDASVFYDYKDDFPIKKYSQYLRCYEKSGDEKYKLDASVFNMYSEESIKKILIDNPSSKFIIVLRDPVESAVSMYKQRLKYHDKKMREVSASFMDCWDMLEDRKKDEGYPKGCRNKFLFRYDLLYKYEIYLPGLIELIPESQLLILFHSDMKLDIEDFMKKIFTYLGVNSVSIKNEIINPSVVVRRSLINDIVLKTYFYCAPIIKMFPYSKLIRKKIINMLNSINEPVKLNLNVDKKVYDFFNDTYKFLDKLKCM